MFETIAFAALLSVAALPDDPQPYRIYHIGNSLTWDSRPDLLGQTTMLRDTVIESGHHIYCNSSLDDIVSLPWNTCVTPNAAFGPMLEALTLHRFDAITVQPFGDGTSTLGSDVEAIVQIVSIIESAHGPEPLTVYVYQSWGQSWRFINYLDEPLPTGANTLTNPHPAYIDALMFKLDQVLPAHVSLRLIPVGMVWHAIYERINSGELTGITFSNLYRDSIHASFPLGRYIAHATTYGAITGDHPGEMYQEWIAASPGHDGGFSEDQYKDLNEVIWDVIKNEPRVNNPPDSRKRACSPADLSMSNAPSATAYLFGLSDGVLTPTDFSAFTAMYASGDSRADISSASAFSTLTPGFGIPDGQITPSDYYAYIAYFMAGCPCNLPGCP